MTHAYTHTQTALLHAWEAHQQRPCPETWRRYESAHQAQEAAVAAMETEIETERREGR